MRLGQNRRMRGRNRSNKGPNPLTRTYESNGPDVKIRGTAQHIAEKYAQLSRDAQASGDPIAAENYLQHAEHYFRIIASSQEQMRQQYGQYQRLPDDDQDESEIEDNGNGYAYDGGEQPVIEDMEFTPQPAPESSPIEGRRETRHLRRGRYGRLDRSRNNNNIDQPRFEPESGDEEQAASPRHSRQEQPVERAPRRRTAAARVASEDEGSSSLPAFLTTPLRQAAPAKTETKSENLFGEPEVDEAPKPVRRRRTTRSDEAKAGADKL